MNSFGFQVGTIECVALHDGDMDYRATDYVVNAAPEEVELALQAHRHEPDRIPSPYSGLLVRTDSHLLLVDTGAGNFTPRTGMLLRNLRQAGVAPEDIDTVILTHGHPDHIGGNVDSDGNPCFQNARYVMFAAEWNYWTDQSILARLPAVFGEWSRQNLDPLAERIELLERETEIVPGVEAIDSAGHTPGHLAVAIRSGSAELLYVSDAALHPIHLEHPDWHPVWDVEPEQALVNKRRLFDRAATSQGLVLAFHFPPFPSLGRVTRHGRGWRWHTSVEAGE